MKRTARIASVAAALACAAPCSAQLRLASERHSAAAFEAGFVAFGEDRYQAGIGIGVHAGAGWRWQTRGVFVEPHLRALIADPFVGGDRCSELGCASDDAGARDGVPVVWPGISAGIVFGDDYFSNAFGARLAAGIDETVQPLVGVRYEGSARWFGWFLEASSERVRWHDGGHRWQPALSVGARWWTRRVTVPAPDRRADAGILPETFDEGYRDAGSSAPAARGRERHLAVWAHDGDRVGAPFLAIVDVDSASPTYGTVTRTLEVGPEGENAHHSELAMPAGGRIWVSSFGGETFLLDVTRPDAPALAGTLARAPGMQHPHSIARLPDGNVLVTYQMDAAGTGPGGIALHSADGLLIRTGSAADPLSDAFVRPYSALVLPERDRVLTTGADMHESDTSRVVQLWRLSDLSLLRTIELPAGPNGDENVDSFEARALPDGSAFVVTIGCGLYEIDDVASRRAEATLIHKFGDDLCFMPAVVGFWWLQTLAHEGAIEVLDMTHPGAPRVASRLQLPEGYEPHWLGADAAGDRIVVTGYGAMEDRVLLLRLDRRTGALTIDADFGDDAAAPGIRLEGPAGVAAPHAAVFVP